MPLSFDDVIPRLLEIGITNALLTKAERIAVVRDPKGRVRLAIREPAANAVEQEALEQVLAGELAGWYVGPAVYAHAGGAQQRVALNVIDRTKGKWPVSWPKE